MFGLIKKIFFGECGSDSELQERRLALEMLKEVARAIECDVAVVRAREERLRLEREEKLRKEREERKLVLEDREDADTSDVRYSISRIWGDSSRLSIVSSLVPDYEKYPPFGIMLARMVKDRCENKASLCYRRAGVSKQTYSRIISNPYSGVNKTIAMRLCIGLRLPIEEAKRLLAAAGYTFSEAIYEDRIFSYCLQNAIYNILDVELMLQEGERILLSKGIKR